MFVNLYNAASNYTSYIFIYEKWITSRKWEWGTLWRPHVRHEHQKFFTKAFPHFLYFKKGAPFYADCLFKRLVLGSYYRHVFIECHLTHVPFEWQTLYWTRMNELEIYHEINVLFNSYFLLIFSQSLVLKPNPSYAEPFNSHVEWDQDSAI